MSTKPDPTAPGPISQDERQGPIRAIGQLADDRLSAASTFVSEIGGMTLLLGDAGKCLAQSAIGRGTRLRAWAVAEQMVRIGVNSIPIVMLVQGFIGCILALQIAPTMEAYGQLDKVAVVVAIAVVRELGPMITAIVLSGFAGASIAAEIGAMVEAEEVKALRASALDPVQFLVVPRLLASVVMIIGLAVIADIVGMLGGLLTSVAVLDIPWRAYVDTTQTALTMSDLTTGLFKAAVFGGLVSLIACYQGMHVTGGAVGVGRSTTVTVVKSIVAIIGTDAVFAAVFYALGW